MKEQTGRKLRFIYGIVFSILAVFVGVLFIVQTWSVYTSAPESPYTPSTIAAHFNEIAIPVWLLVAAVIGNIALAFVYPEGKEKLKAEIDPSVTLRRMRLKVAETEAMKKERILRYVFNGCIALVSVGGLILCVATIYAKSYTPMLSAAFFTDHNALVDRLVRVAVYALAGLLLCILLDALKTQSQKREIKLCKDALIVNAKNPIKAEGKAKTERKELPERWLWILRGALCLVGIVLVIWGIANGGMSATLKKAINICTQCIGLG